MNGSRFTLRSILVVFAVIAVDVRAQAPRCEITSASLGDMASAIDTQTLNQSRELCSLAPAQASKEDQTALLNLIREKAIARIPRLTASLTAAQVASTKNEWQQLRVLMGLKAATFRFEGGTERVRNGTATIEAELPSRLASTPGFAGAPEALTAAERAKAQAAIAATIARLKATARESASTQYNELYALGVNPDVPVAETVGRLGETAALEVRRAAQTGYQEMVARNPALLFLSSANPSDADVRAARAKYVEALAGEPARLRGLDTQAPADAALALLFYGPAVDQTIAENPALCPALNALKNEMRNRQKFADMMSLGLGVAAGGACLAATVFSAGLLGAGCLALSVAELGVTGDQALKSAEQSHALYRGVLQGGDIDAYLAERDRASGYLIAAGFSAVGVVGGALDAASILRPATATVPDLAGEAATVARMEDTVLPAPQSASVALPPNPTWTDLYPNYRTPFRMTEEMGFVERNARLKELGLVRAGGPNDIAITPLAGARTPLAEQVARLNAQGVEFIDAGDMHRAGLAYIESSGRIKVAVNKKFFEDAAYAEDQLEYVASFLEARKAYAERGIQIAPALNSSTENPVIQIRPTDGPLAPSDPLAWIRNRADRFGIKVIVDDSQFGPGSGTAFAQNDVVYIRRSTLMNMKDNAWVVGHELVHATNFVKCQRYGDCGGKISFRGLNGTRVAGSDLYADFFGADELQAYLVTYRQTQDPSYIASAHDFGRSQQILLTALRNGLSDGSLSFRTRQTVVVNGRGGAQVEVRFGDVNRFTNEADARAHYLKVVEERLRVVDFRMKQLERMIDQ